MYVRGRVMSRAGATDRARVVVASRGGRRYTDRPL
jgi:hypothetical protein